MVHAARRLTLVVPGLLGKPGFRQVSAVWQGLQLPALETLLARSVRSGMDGVGLERGLFTLFRIKPAGDTLPVAAVTRQWDAQDAGQSWWLRADPVHLRADRDRLVMLGNKFLDINDADCKTLAAELNTHFSSEPWQVLAVNARRWYLRLESDPGIEGEVLFDVVGQDIFHHMPQGQQQRYWRSVMNEMQMVLHGSEINRDRETRGKPAVNSLWLWGSGRLPSARPGAWQRVWGDEELTRSLATLTGAPCVGLPEDASQWLASAEPGDHLIVLEGLRDILQSGEMEFWRERVEAMEEYWLQPLLQALQQRELDELTISPAQGVAYCVTARNARRWWVRRQPLQRLLD